MVWLIEKNIIFIHIPKTGGTTIEKYMTTMDNKTIYETGYGVFKTVVFQHLLWNDYVDFLGNKMYNNSITFSVVRHPYTRMVSEYYWNHSGNGYKVGISFDEYLDRVEHMVFNNCYSQTIYDDHFIPQHKFIYNNNDDLMIDKLFYFEEFDDVFHFLENHDIYGTKYHEHMGITKDKIILNETQKKRIYEVYKKDFELLNYKP